MAEITPWSDAEIALAAQLWSREGYTGKQIAEALNKRFGNDRTEAVVLRLAARLRNQFPPRGPGHSALSRVFERLGARKDFDIRPTAGEAAAYDAASRKLTLIDLSARECRFPVATSGTTHLFCGAPTGPQQSYCPHHEIRVFSDREEAAA